MKQVFCLLGDEELVSVGYFNSRCYGRTNTSASTSGGQGILSGGGDVSAETCVINRDKSEEEGGKGVQTLGLGVLGCGGQ